MVARTSLEDEPYFCNFIHSTTREETRCSMSVANLAYPYTSDVVFTLSLWSAFNTNSLEANSPYEIVLSRNFATDGLNGNEWTSTPGIYYMIFD